MSSPWLCDSLRVSAIWRSPIPVESPLSWEAVAGAAPEIHESQPRQGTTKDAGPIGDGARTLELRTGPGRIDWLLLPIFNLPMLADLSRSIPNLGEVGDALRAFDAFLFEQAAAAYAAPRLALGVTALHPAPDRDSSYSELRSILSTISPNLDGSSDFLYQINRPRESSAAPGVTINRLARWGSVVMAGITVQSFVPQASGSVTQVQTPTAHATRIELDLSTSAERESELPLESRVPLLREMATLAMQVIEQGDRA